MEIATLSTARNATLADLATILQQQRGRQLDVIASATALRSRGGVLHIDDTGEPTIDDSGVTPTAGRFVPTAVFDEGIAAKLGIPVHYLRKLRAEYPDLYDTNINMWLHGKIRRAGGVTEVVRAADHRTFFIRLFRGDNGDGVARALLSDRYKPMDNLDVLTAVLQAVQESGVDAEVVNANLTDRTMYLDVAAPQVAALAPVLLGGYRNPFDDPNIDAQRRAAGRPDSELGYWRRVAHHDGMGYDPGAEPIVFAGFRIRNCEVGGGAFQLEPRLVVQVCRNGLTLNQDVLREVHLGGRLEPGLVNWSAATQRAARELVMAKTRDAVRTFLDLDYLRTKLEKIETAASEPVDDPVKTVALVGKTCGFTDAEIDGVLGFFTRGGQMTAGGVTNAITAFSQTVADADRATELDAQALRAMQLVT